MATNREIGIRFRNEVLLYLLANRVVCHDPFAGKRVSELVGDAAAFTDIGGLGWVIDVRTSRGLELSSGLADAKRLADSAGCDWYMTIQARRGYPLGDAYCIVPLSVMSRVFRGELPTMGSPSGVQPMI